MSSLPKILIDENSLGVGLPQPTLRLHVIGNFALKTKYARNALELTVIMLSTARYVGT